MSKKIYAFLSFVKGYQSLQELWDQRRSTFGSNNCQPFTRFCVRTNCVVKLSVMGRTDSCTVLLSFVLGQIAHLNRACMGGHLKRNSKSFVLKNSTQKMRDVGCGVVSENAKCRLIRAEWISYVTETRKRFSHVRCENSGGESQKWL